MSLNFLDDVAEFKELVRSLESGDKNLRISGLIEAAKPYFFSFLAQKLEKRIVFIQPASASLSRLEEQCRFFSSQWAPSKHVKALPALKENPYQEASPPLEAVSSRLQFFYDLLYRKPSLILTNLFGLLKPFPSPEEMPRLFLRLAKSDFFDRDKLIQTLEEYGYSREDLISFRGEYAWRGGIVDVFTPWQTVPYRFEFSGDEIVSLREFDPSTQRSLRKLDRVLVPSLLESPGHDDDGVHFTAYLEDSVFIVDHAEEVRKEWDEAIEELSAEAEALRTGGRNVQPPEKIFPPHLWDTIQKEAVLCEDFESRNAKKVFHYHFQSVPRFDNRIPFFLDYARRLQRERERCSIFLSSKTIRKKISSLFAQNEIPAIESDSPFTLPKSG